MVTPPNSPKVAEFLSALKAWAASRADIVAVALVGSHARGQATPESDVDIVLLTMRPEDYLEDRRWLDRFGRVLRQQPEDWGRVTALRTWYQDGLEVEFGITTPDWAEAPLDEGTRQVVEAGFAPVFDRKGILRTLKS